MSKSSSESGKNEEENLSCGGRRDHLKKLLTSSHCRSQTQIIFSSFVSAQTVRPVTKGEWHVNRCGRGNKRNFIHYFKFNF